MSRYRKVHIRMWGDERFRSLSAPQPNAQTLWIYLLTGSETTPIPGVVRGGEMSLAESLCWPLEAFRVAMREVISHGMAKANFDYKLIYIPKAIFYNPPESINVVKSWATTFDELPECPLKLTIYHGLKAYLDDMSEGFRKAYAMACRKPSLIQEQEQEQEQDPSSPPPDPVAELPPEKRSRGRARVAWPEGMELSAAMREYAVARAVDAAAEFEKFHDWALGNAIRKADWQAAWRTWVRKAPEFAGRAAGTSPARRMARDMENLDRLQQRAQQREARAKERERGSKRDAGDTQAGQGDLVHATGR